MPRILDPRFENQHAVVGFGDFAHDVGEAGVALWCAELEGVNECGESDRADRYAAFACGWITGIETIEFD